MRAAAALAIVSMMVAPAMAQVPPPPPVAPNAGPVLPPPAPRARGPALDPSIEMARTAVATCLANGYKVTALVVDSAGVPVVMLSGDGAMQRTHVIAPTKIAMVLQYREGSGVTTARAKTDAALAAALAANPKVGTPRQGGLPILVGGEMIGAIAVSGAPGGGKDEVCAQAGLDKVKAQLR